MIRSVNAEPEAGGSANGGQTLLLGLQPARVLIANALNARDQSIAFALQATEADAAGIGKIGFGGIEDLEQVATDRRGGETADRCLDFRQWRQEVAEQHNAGMARQR